MSQKSPKSLIKSFGASQTKTGRVPTSPRHLMKEFPTDKASSGKKTDPNSRNTKKMIREYIEKKDVRSGEVENAAILTTPEDEEFSRLMYSDLLGHPTLKGCFPKIVNGIFSMELSETSSLSTVTSSNKESKCSFSVSVSETLRSSDTGLTAKPSPSSTPKSVAFREPPSGSSNPTSARKKRPVKVQQPSTNIMESSVVFSCEFSTTAHRELLRHHSFEHCSPDINNGVFVLRSPLTNHLLPSSEKSTSVSTQQGSVVSIASFIAENVGPVNVDITAAEKEIHRQYLQSCVLMETFVSTMCVVMCLLIAVAVVVWLVVLMEGKNEVSLSDDWASVVSATGSVLLGGNMHSRNFLESSFSSLSSFVGV